MAASPLFVRALPLFKAALRLLVRVLPLFTVGLPLFMRGLWPSLNQSTLARAPPLVCCSALCDVQRRRRLLCAACIRAHAPFCDAINLSPKP
eukprot:594641-Rhodomonas_salina.1